MPQIAKLMIRMPNSTVATALPITPWLALRIPLSIVNPIVTLVRTGGDTPSQFGGEGRRRLKDAATLW